MTDPIVLTIPQDIATRARQIAEMIEQPVEQVLIEHLKTLATPLPTLPPEEQAELDALRHLSDDALWTIAREQMPEDVQIHARKLMNKNAQGTSTDEDSAALENWSNAAIASCCGKQKPLRFCGSGIICLPKRISCRSMNELSWTAIKRLVHERAAGCCEYCRTAEANSNEKRRLSPIQKRKKVCRSIIRVPSSGMRILSGLMAELVYKD
jgi:hypothetical protein